MPRSKHAPFHVGFLNFSDLFFILSAPPKTQLFEFYSQISWVPTLDIIHRHVVYSYFNFTIKFIGFQRQILSIGMQYKQYCRCSFLVINDNLLDILLQKALHVPLPTSQVALDLYIDLGGENTSHLSRNTRSKSRNFSEDLDRHLNDILLSNQWFQQPYIYLEMLY